MIAYVFACDVKKKEWIALPRDFKKGEKIYRYVGHDYGCSRDDMLYGNVDTIACSLDGNTPFFTVPCGFLLTEDGKEPHGDYFHIQRGPK